MATVATASKARSVAVFLLTLLLSAIVGLVLAFPLAGALVCPRCYRFEALPNDVHVETTMTPQMRAQAQAALADARSRVQAFYGALLREPRILVCATEACYRRFAGGGSRGMAFFDRALLLAPNGVTAVIAAHELAHVELHARAGAWRVYRGAIPRWFDEGLAVNVSDDPRYLAPGRGAARCRGRTDEPLPATRGAWLADADDRLYAAAACRVSRWLDAEGGAGAASALAGRIAAGARFEDLVR